MSEYMQGGALASDDLDFSASSDRGRASEHASTAVKSPALNVAIGVSAVVMVVGLVLWFMQLSGGMVQTAMRNLDSWGLYITGFMFFVGLSAGGLIISSVPKALGIRGFGGISKVAVFSSIACTVVAIGLVVVDMGQPFRSLEDAAVFFRTHSRDDPAELTPEALQSRLQRRDDPEFPWYFPVNEPIGLLWFQACEIPDKEKER